MKPTLLTIEIFEVIIKINNDCGIAFQFKPLKWFGFALLLIAHGLNRGL